MEGFHTFTNIDSSLKVESHISINTSTKNLHLSYPCQFPYSCSPFEGFLGKGVYNIKICGANGGVKPEEQIEGKKESDHPHAGGCTSGTILISSKTKIYVHLGGHGSQDGTGSYRSHGGNNGGARGYFNPNPTSGGGATDIRFEENDVFHRVLVAGGGGGSDNIDNNYYDNDGKGGSGGGTTAQGWYTSNNKISTFPIANQTFGFTFGNGEASLFTGSKHEFGVKEYQGTDTCGAGGGWFGGFASNYINSGCGGGSSYALTLTSPIPQGIIHYHDDEYNLIDQQEYAFSNRKYIFYNDIYERGVWFGNGFADITFLGDLSMTCKKSLQTPHSILYFIMIMIK